MGIRDSSSTDMLDRAYTVSSSEDVQRLYRDWSKDYDQHLRDGLGYIAPAVLSAMLAQRVPDHKTKVLDVGCGTGLVGAHLAELGYVDIDGLDFSPEMLGVARRKNFYRKLIAADLNQPLNLSDESYGAMICCGTFTLGHVGPEALNELLRILKRGAPLVCTINTEVWVKRGFDRWLDVAESEKKLVLEKKTREKYFFKSNERGFFCILTKN